MFCMMHLMCYVNTAWARVGIKRNRKMSEVTTSSDEALVSWLLLCYVEEWTKEMADGEEHSRENPNGDKKLPKRVKRRNEHYSRSKLYKFVQLEDHIHSLRRSTTDWDEAVAAGAERLHRKKEPGKK